MAFSEGMVGRDTFKLIRLGMAGGLVFGGPEGRSLAAGACFWSGAAATISGSDWLEVCYSRVTVGKSLVSVCVSTS